MSFVLPPKEIHVPSVSVNLNYAHWIITYKIEFFRMFENIKRILIKHYFPLYALKHVLA